MKLSWKKLAVFAGLLIAVLFLLDARVNATASSNTQDKTNFIVSEPVTPALSPAVRDLQPQDGSTTLNREINPLKWMGEGIGTEGLSSGLDALAADGVNSGETPNPLFTFEAQGNFNQYTPPDTDGDVGPDHYIQMVNVSFTIYDKTGTLLAGPTPFNDLFTGVGGNCESDNSGDPIVLYDELADRWMLTQFAVSSGQDMCFAISKTSDPLGQYWLYEFGPLPDFPDYPKIGVWPDAYYMGTNSGFPNAYYAYAFDRVKMLAGQPATYQAFGGYPNFMMPADVDGTTPPPAGTPGKFYTMLDAGYPNHPAGVDRITFYEFDVDWTTPGNTTFTLDQEYPIAAYNYTVCGFFVQNCIPQPGTGQTIDSLSYWPMFRLAYRNLGSYEAMVGNFTIDLDNTNKAAIRWFEMRDEGAGWDLYQEGTYAPNSDHRWMGSIAMDGSGNVALGYSVSSTSTIPSIRYASRLRNDPLGTLQAEATGFAGTGVQTGVVRWGDYSAMSVDPADNCTFWYTTEYHETNDTGFSWNTRVIVFRLPECTGALGPDFTLTVTPDTQAICTPDDAVFNVNVGQVEGYTDQVTLSALGNPAGTTATFSVNPVTPPGTSDLTIGSTGSAAAGNYSIDVVGVAATSTHTATVTLDVYTAAPGAPTLTSPADGTTGVTLQPTYQWDAVSQAASYMIEIATDAGFTNVVDSATVSTNSYDSAISLDPLTVYYWRVQADNTCGNGNYSSTFSFTTTAVPPILLVDDDDNGPDNSATYISALDNLGLLYDIWDTNNTDTEPSAAQLAPYQAVVWFTGDEFGGAAGPGSAGETALGTWLDSGGTCLFISGQDYHYDRGLTPFMTTYLGASSITDDSGDYTSVTGQGTVFGGLGPYTLTYPFTDYSDPITPNGTAELAFQGNNGNGAAITKDGGTYKTTFWVFPLEAISTAEGRETSLQTFFDWCGTSPNAGGLEGTVTDAVTGDPIAGATVEVVGPVSDSTNTNASGQYSFNLLAGSYDVTASAPNYFPETVTSVSVITGSTTVEDFALIPIVPEIVVDPNSYDVTYGVDTIVTVGLTISNPGNGDLDWTIEEDAVPTVLYSTVTLPSAQVGTVSFGDGPFTFTPRSTGKGETVQHTLNAPEGLTTISHSATQNITTGNSVSCNAGGLHTDNSYLRHFTLADFGITDAFDVTEVSFGVEQATGATGNQPLTVNLYTWDPSDPFTWVNLTLVGSANASVPDQTLSIFTVPVTGNIPAGGTLVVEVFTPEGQTDGNSFFIGSNADGQTSPSYLAAADCGVTEPTDTAGIGFPNMQIVMNVTGETGPNVGVCVNPEDVSWVNVNPLSGTTAAASSSTVDVTFDTTGLTVGSTYTGTLCVGSNDPVNPLVTVPLTLTVEAPTYGVVLSADQTASANAGETVTYTLTVTNTGNSVDTIDLSGTGVWATVLSDVNLTLSVGESATFTVAVTVPNDAADGDSDVTTVTATSQGDVTATDSADLTTTADVPAPPSFEVFLPVISNNN